MAIDYRTIFERNFRDIDESDLRKLIQDQVAEGLFVEYKSTWPDSKKIAASICSFANSHGGYLAIGIDANQTHNIPTDIPGVPLEEG